MSAGGGAIHCKDQSVKDGLVSYGDMGVGNRVGVPVSRTEYIFCFRRRESSIRRTWPALRSWCFIIIASLLVVLASSNTLFVVRLSCHFFSRIHLTLWSWNFSRNVMLWLQVTQLSKAYRIAGRTMALHTFEFFILYFYQCIGWILSTECGQRQPRFQGLSSSLLQGKERRETLRTRLCEHG